MRYELTDEEWAAIKPTLPNKPRGVPRGNDRRVLNGIFRLRCVKCAKVGKRPPAELLQVASRRRRYPGED
jgi:hypothetical protein